MRKILLITILAACAMAACTNKTMTRNFGGEDTLKLSKGQRLVEVTWKKNNLWILTEPMDSGYVPKTKTFFENSEFEFWEGSITIIESR